MTGVDLIYVEPEPASKSVAQAVHHGRDPLGREFFLLQPGEPVHPLCQAGEDRL